MFIAYIVVIIYSVLHVQNSLVNNNFNSMQCIIIKNIYLTQKNKKKKNLTKHSLYYNIKLQLIVKHVYLTKIYLLLSVRINFLKQDLTLFEGQNNIIISMFCVNKLMNWLSV